MSSCRNERRVAPRAHPDWPVLPEIVFGRHMIGTVLAYDFRAPALREFNAVAMYDEVSLPYNGIARSPCTKASSSPAALERVFTR